MMELLMLGLYFLLKRKPLVVTAETATGLYAVESLACFCEQATSKETIESVAIFNCMIDILFCKTIIKLVSSWYSVQYRKG